MMTAETKRRIAELRKFFGDKPFSKEDLLYHAPYDIYVSLNTLLRHEVIKRIKIDNIKEYSLDELIEEVNEMIGEDYYGGTGQFVRKGDKIFFVDSYYSYQFV